MMRLFASVSIKQAAPFCHLKLLAGTEARDGSPAIPWQHHDEKTSPKLHAVAQNITRQAHACKPMQGPHRRYGGGAAKQERRHVGDAGDRDGHAAAAEALPEALRQRQAGRDLVHLLHCLQPLCPALASDCKALDAVSMDVSQLQEQLTATV